MSQNFSNTTFHDSFDLLAFLSLSELLVSSLLDTSQSIQGFDVELPPNTRMV